MLIFFMKLSKKILIWFLSIVALILLVWFGMAARSAWQGYQWQKQTDAFQAALTKPYREDTYGGKTPEETWTMFLDALKKGDIELASKYFVVEKQADWKKILEDTSKVAQLDGVVKSLNTLRFDSFDQNKSKAYFYRDVLNEKNQKRSSSVVFLVNPYTRIWKISVL